MFTMDRWFLIWFVYVAGTASVFEIACTVVPFLDKYYSLAARTVFWFVVAHSIFVFTRDKIFKQRVKAGNKAVFITGCDSGFGNQLAKQLDSKGFRVFAGCLFSYNGGAAELKRSCSSRLHIVHLDVTKDESVQKAKEFVKNNLAGCDLWAVVNNAGVLKGFTVEFSKMSDYQDTLEVNTLGQVRVTNAFLPLLRECRGRIVNVNSLAGRACSPHLAAYTMSKHASVAFTECLRREMESWGVKVISVEPEFFKTPMTNRENMIKCIDFTCKDVGDGIKYEYGELYMERVKTMIAEIFAMSPSNTHLVTDAIEAAVSMQHPCSVYRPTGSKIRHFLRFCSEYLPSHFVDVGLKIIQILFRVPTPKAARKS